MQGAHPSLFSLISSSLTSTDAALIGRLREALKLLGIPEWADSRALVGGSMLAASIARARRACRTRCTD